MMYDVQYVQHTIHLTYDVPLFYVKLTEVSHMVLIPPTRQSITSLDEVCNPSARVVR